MASKVSSRPLATCLHCARQNSVASSLRLFSTSANKHNADAQPASFDQQGASMKFNPELVSKPSQERALFKATGKLPVGSRRRRAVLKQMRTNSVPFEQLPYQCFQEARKILLEDRQEKYEQIRVQRDKMDRLKAQDVAPQNEAGREKRINSMRKTLEELKIHADINDPLIKKKFEDGMGDLNKPIYRYLADRKWRTYKRKVLVQRITQMNVVPDVLPNIDPVVNTQLIFRGRNVQHGDIVESFLSELPPQLQIQPYDRGERLFTIAVVNPDVPNVANDGFDSRCHFLASNISISPTEVLVNFAGLDEKTQLIQPWLPAYSQKGLPYQRMSVCILEQPAKDSNAAADGNQSRSQLIDVNAIREKGRDTVRDGFSLRSLITRFQLKPVGIDLFRTVYDAGTAGVMERAGITGGDVEFKRKRIEPLPYKRLSTDRYR